MRAAILAVGSELLSTDRLDTNSLKIAGLLERFGVELVGKAVVGDRRDRLAAHLSRLAQEVELVVVCGGLGPTEDDLTRRALADALGREVAIDEEIVRELERRFAAWGRKMAPSNRKQGEMIEGATRLDNPLGTAPGQRVEEGATTFFLLPGPPRELAGLLESAVEPFLEERCGSASVERGLLKVACLPESEVEQRIRPFYERWGSDDISVLSAPGEIRVEVKVKGETAARAAAIGQRLDQLSDLIGPAVFTRSEADSLEGVVGRLLEERGATVSTAESCTGGLIAQRFTSVAGSSAWFVGGIVAYENRVKEALLGVSPALLAEHGAVSREVADAMATGARDRLGTDYALAVTGIAGPGGGTEEKPVGTVCLALAHEGGAVVTQLRFPGERGRVRRFSSQIGLEMLRRFLLGVSLGRLVR